MHQHSMKRKAFALAALMALTLTACSSETPPVSAPEASTPPAQSEAAAPITQAEPVTADAPDTPEEPVTASEPATPDTPAEPERAMAGAMLLDSKEQTVYSDISDTEIILWDSASGGQIVAVAKFPQPMQGAAEALQACDFTDLDGDGTSDLTASFSFPDGTAASLLWFYTDGGLVYNEEFSILPGEAHAGGAE